MSLTEAQTDLAMYASAMWPKFECASHHRLIIEELERVERGEVDRLMIFMPPRHGKSLITSQLFPSWYLGRNPSKSIILASYGAELALDFGRRVRGFVTDGMHRRIFPGPATGIEDDNAAAHRFGLRGGGAFYAVGAGGPITGRGADLLLIDDPIKSREVAYSAAERRSLQQWYESVAYTRLQPGGAIVLIQTRWHMDDLAGWLMREHAEENWRVVSLPAEAELNDPLDRQEGKALWPEKYPIESLERIREAIGTASWTALYQQRPTLEEGGIFKLAWFKTFADPPSVANAVMSIDCAFKTGKENDYSVILVMGALDNGFFLFHVSRGRWEFGELERQVMALADIWKPRVLLIEDAASGQSLIQTLVSDTRLPVQPIKPLGDKQSRAHAISPLVESGRIYLPAQSAWGRDFLDELTSFPAAPHDDQVDAFTQALDYLYSRGWTDRDSKVLAEVVEQQRRYLWNQPPRTFDSPGAMFRQPGTSPGYDAFGRAMAPLYGDPSAVDAAEDAGGRECEGWGAGARLPRGRRGWPGRGRCF